MRNLISLDLETTGLDERRHEAWEVALVEEDGERWCYQFEANLEKADGEALQIGQYYARCLAKGGGAYDVVNDLCLTRGEASRCIAALTEGSVLMGCSVHFDARFLAVLLRANKVQPAWHHRHLDLASFTAGASDVPLPLSSQEIQKIVPNDYAHTALGDALWNWEVYKRYVDA